MRIGRGFETHVWLLGRRSRPNNHRPFLALSNVFQSSTLFYWFNFETCFPSHHACTIYTMYVDVLCVRLPRNPVSHKEDNTIISLPARFTNILPHFLLIRLALNYDVDAVDYSSLYTLGIEFMNRGSAVWIICRYALCSTRIYYIILVVVCLILACASSVLLFFRISRYPYDSFRTEKWSSGIPYFIWKGKQKHRNELKQEYRFADDGCGCKSNLIKKRKYAKR